MRLPAIERGDEPPLAVEPVLDVLGELRVRVENQRAVPGTQQLEPLAPEPLEPPKVAGQRPCVWKHEHAPFAEHGVSRESGIAGHEREVIRRVSRRPGRGQRPEYVAFAELDVYGPAGGRDRRLGEPLADRAHRLCVVGVVVGECDSAEAAAPLELGDERLDVGSAAPARDQPATPGPDPTIHELVPLSVNGPGFAARMPTRSSRPGTSRRVMPAG